MPSYPLTDVDQEQNILVAVAVVDLQHHGVLRPRWAIVDVLDLFLWQLLQLESAERSLAVESGQTTVTRRFEDHEQDIGWVVKIFDLQDRLCDGCLVASALHG